LATGSITESFACMSSGRNPSFLAWAKTVTMPRSASSTLRKPWSAARRMSSRQATTCSWPWTVGATTAPAAERAIAETPQPAFGRANRLTSTRASAAMRAISSSSASVSRKTPLPWETRCTRTSSRSASSSTASRQRGPSVLGISTRYWAPSAKRAAESGSEPRSPGGRPMERRNSRDALTARAYRSRLRLLALEERLPAVEQRLELVACGPVGGEELHVAPVVGELPLEVGDGLLLPGDARLHLLELARLLWARPLWPRSLRPWLSS